MAYVTGGKHFGQYTYEHWYDHEYKYEAENKTNADSKKLLKGFSYNGHLGGILGKRIFARLVELGWFELEPTAGEPDQRFAGIASEEKSTETYKITPLGEQKLTELGVDIYIQNTAASQ